MGIINSLMRFVKGGDGMSNSVNPDQTAISGTV